MRTRKGKPQTTVEASAQVIVLRLYIVGGAPNSMQAIANAEAICREQAGTCDLEVIDVLEHPQRAMAEGIVVTPTLKKVYPQPTAQIVGNLSDKPRVLLAIGARSQST